MDPSSSRAPLLSAADAASPEFASAASPVSDYASMSSDLTLPKTIGLQFPERCIRKDHELGGATFEADMEIDGVMLTMTVSISKKDLKILDHAGQGVLNEKVAELAAKVSAAWIQAKNADPETTKVELCGRVYHRYVDAENYFVVEMKKKERLPDDPDRERLVNQDNQIDELLSYYEEDSRIRRAADKIFGTISAKISKKA